MTPSHVYTNTEEDLFDHEEIKKPFIVEMITGSSAYLRLKIPLKIPEKLKLLSLYQQGTSHDR